MFGLIKIRTLRYMFAFLSNIRRLGNIKGLIQDDIFLRKITFYCEIYLNKYNTPLRGRCQKKEDLISPLSLCSV